MKIISLLFIISTVCGYTQTPSVSLNFLPLFGKEKLEPGRKYFSSTITDSISIESFRFYVSNISLLKNDKIVYQPKGSFYLIDLEKKLQIPMNTDTTLDFNSVKFNIGIDSLTNVSGVMGGDLDPTNGMYWTWQSGYINFKLEGKSKLCNTRNNLFQFHIGGYQRPFNTLQVLKLPVKNKSKIEIIIDVENFLRQIDLQKTNEIMSPGEKAMRAAKLYHANFNSRE